jgi:CheY-like chemotaxis protein
MLVARPSAVKKFKVLAVDDKRANLLALEAVLDDECELTLASSGAEAIGILERRADFDTILMDLHMPEMDGFETTRRLKKIRGCEDIPVMFLTAVYTEEPFVQKGYEAGAIDYLTKPYDPEIIRKKVAIYATFRQRRAVLEERDRQLNETLALLAAGRRLSATLEEIPTGVLITDSSGQLRQANRDAKSICRAGGADGPWWEVLGWWDANGRMVEDHAAALVRTLRGDPTTMAERVQVSCNDGETRSILLSPSMLMSIEGSVLGATVVVRDVSEPREVERDLEHYVAELGARAVQLEDIEPGVRDVEFPRH